MGIPSYFSYVLKHHKIMKRLNDVKCNSLFLDANSIIYDVIYDTNSNLNSNLNSNIDIYHGVFDKIKHIIDKINPTFTYVSFDGVVPLAKMSQQKQRRYKSYLTKKILKKNNWNTNAITPGTTFMNELDDYLKNELIHSTMNTIFSGSKENGEGEQKIFEYIRNHEIDGNVFIYGLDADLIMLSLLHLQNADIYLYRETKHFAYIKGVNPELDYVFNMDEMGLQIEAIFEKNESKNAIENYCFLCFLCGNDFLPHFASIQIRNHGIDYLIEVYKKINKPLVSGTNINWSTLHELCSELGEKEEELIKLNVEWKKKMASYSCPLTPEESLDALPLKDIKREIYVSTHLDKYYSFLFKNEEKDVCKNYLQMLEWTWFYYHGINKNNYMCYHFHCAPLFSSLKKYIPCFNEELVEIDETPPPSSIVQLLYVLPYEDYHLIPIDTKPIEKKYINLTETNFLIHFDFCKFFWEGHVDFNYIDIKDLDRFLK